MQNVTGKKTDKEILATDLFNPSANSDNQALLDPEVQLDLILDDIELLLKRKYPDLSNDKNLFNISRLQFLLGGQFRIARLVREQGFVIQDCEMCLHYDCQFSYCQYYRLRLTRREDSYYYAGLCPALRING
ncbi:hypothetical protein [Acetonema longum]|uniref:hypothetical protein n=1 Tax=Acetonema longum TaxID=2374 RepID=UPI001111FB00|nr:hypothetical protein [Acetonema longum]